MDDVSMNIILDRQSIWGWDICIQFSVCEKELVEEAEKGQGAINILRNWVNYC